MNQNNNFEFKSYIPTPTDQYMLGLAKIKLYGKVIASFKHVKTKDGTGTFFCPANYSMLDATGEKKYIPCVMLDSRDDEEELQAFIRENVNKAIAQRSTHQANATDSARYAAPQSGQYYPHGMAQQSPIQQEVAKQEDLPF